jgi:hypothetical protein
MSFALVDSDRDPIAGDRFKPGKDHSIGMSRRYARIDKTGSEALGREGGDTATYRRMTCLIEPWQ